MNPFQASLELYTHAVTPYRRGARSPYQGPHKTSIDTLSVPSINPTPTPLVKSLIITATLNPKPYNPLNPVIV